MTPLILFGMHNTSEAIISANIEATMWRGYRPFDGNTEAGSVSIVGAGPSLAKTYNRLTGDIIACNSAHDFLIERGITPKYTMIWDAHPVMENIIKPQPNVRYLVASRCHESVFRKLKGCDVTVWHALGDQDIDWILTRYKKPELMVSGGTTSATRAIFLARLMGYRGDFHLHGVDGSYADNGETHVGGSLVKQERVHISVSGRVFSVAPWMALQGEDFKTIIPVMRTDGVRFIVHGDGLVPYCASFLGCETPDLKVGWVEDRIRRPLHRLLNLYTLLRKSPQLLGGFNYAGI